MSDGEVGLAKSSHCLAVGFITPAHRRDAFVAAEVLFHRAEGACIDVGTGREPGSREVDFVTS
jgi:hypothetical protein